MPCEIINIKSKLNQPDIFELLTPSVYNPTPKRLLNRAEKYQKDSKTEVYAYLEGEKFLGIIVFQMDGKVATILDIAVNADNRSKGIGSRLIDFIFTEFDISCIYAETDDDAIDFYKKYGFTVADTKIEYDTKRYKLKKSAD